MKGKIILTLNDKTNTIQNRVIGQTSADLEDQVEVLPSARFITGIH
jgi:hypothetical protein